MALIVNEIFHSIQGESIHSGLPCVFIRLTGCNLRCRYCDTRYAFDEGRGMTVHEIMSQIESFHCNIVEITGGEPLMQSQTPVLVDALLKKGCQVLMETNGSLDIDQVDRRCSRIMDIKCPSSGEETKNDLANLKRLSPNDQVKFVVGDRNDFCFAVEMMSHLPAELPFDRVLFSAISNQLPLKQLAQWVLESRIQARIQTQLHKIIWPEQECGV
ncbi:MAG: 7-carboxy-7-deazaguanine synthase [Deltaproteobacteria bacterium]|nr:MAG: 7-carboxy-7-deazaguanine synthase [Deltaproteobacteria bacterium]